MAFEVGDKVFSLARGWGQVVSVEQEEKLGFPILCFFTDSFQGSPNSVLAYSRAGYSLELAPRSIPDLYHAIPDIIAPEKTRVRTEMEVDAPILVRKKQGWHRMHFSHWGEDTPGVWCWLDGTTSWSEKGDAYWPEWKLPDE